MIKKEFSPTVNKFKNISMEHIDNTFQFENYLKTKKFTILYDQMLWGEGPCYIPRRDMLIWSDIPNNRMLKFINGKVSEFRNPSNFHNGNTLDNEENIISCSHGGRYVCKIDDELKVSILVDSYKGKRLNSPNDVCVKSDGTIWFTDPPYGILSDYEGYPGNQEYGACYVFCFDPKTKNLVVKTTNLNRPNGIAFSHNEKKIYISDTGEDIKHLYVFEIDQGLNLINQKLVYDFKPLGFSDGFRSDKDGNIWTSAGKAIKCFNPNGDIIGQLLVPELVSNLEFGGKEGNILYVTATSSLYKMELNQIGAKFT